MIQRTFVLLLLALAGVGCSESRTLGEDAGITIMLDAGPRADGGGPAVDGSVASDGATMMGPVCGNGRLEAMEACDDGNTDPGDGCDPACAREAYCGDGMITPPELCDDGNNRSADGCRSDCLSTEVCGNSIVDYAEGEVCDSSPGCAPDCSALLGCGDGVVTAPELCDDGNSTRWDGCGADCRPEPTLVVQRLQFGTSMQGCDYTGDGVPDNRFGRALGPAAALLNMGLGGGGGGGAPTFLMSFQGLDDASGANDPELRVAWLQGRAGPSAGSYVVDAGSLNPDGSPRTSLQGDIASRALDAGPEDIDIPISFLPLTLYQGRVRGTTSATAGELSGLSDGLLCGVIPPTQLTAINADLLRMFGGGGFMITIGDPCDGSPQPATLADMLVGGITIAGLRIGNVPPDVDLDGDGLETFEVTRMGPMGCQPVITACVDGDGTRIEGRACVDDPRMADGYSAGLTMTGARATLVSGG